MLRDRRKVIALVILGICVVSALVGIAFIPSLPMDGFSGGKVAVIRIEGSITGSSGLGILGGGTSATDIAKQIKRAGEDPSVEAMVLRINSPGGSAAASQEIYQEVLRARENGKVVVASMGDSATSGGYYVACAADKIVANPGTITGSIGVIFSQLQYSELMERYGIEANVIKSGEYKDIGSPFRNMTDEDRQVLQNMVDDIYNQFVNAVVEGRDMNRSEVLELADGRIFTGRQAQEEGLVDELGNYQDSIQMAADMAGVDKPQVVEYGRRTPFESFLGLFGREIGHGMAQTLLKAGEQEIKFGQFI
ncbi:MAG: signal peptide peptidase SppA [Candidatus Hadarchaeota archaeon]